MNTVSVYRLVFWHRDSVPGYECPVCGWLSVAEARKHGPEHVVEEES